MAISRNIRNLKNSLKHHKSINLSFLLEDLDKFFPFILTRDRLRTYQTLTLIGAVLGILTTIGFWMTMIGLDAFITSFDESMRKSEFYNPDPETRRQYQENKNSMAYINAAAPASIVILIIAIIITMVIKTQTKILGIILIVISVTELILTSAFGILPFALLLPAGILALRWKPPGYEPTYTSSGAISSGK